LPGETEFKLVELRGKSTLVVGELSNNPSNVEPEAGDDELTSIEQEPELEEKVAQRASGRPKLVRTGLPGRPRKEYQMLNVTVDDLNEMKLLIFKKFDVVDGGNLKQFLGMEIKREGETGSIKIGHKQYVEALLNDYGMQNYKPSSIPLEAGHQIKCDDVNKESYQSLIGSLLYLAMTTRPVILHSTVKLVQRNADTHKEH